MPNLSCQKTYIYYWNWNLCNTERKLCAFYPGTLEMRSIMIKAVRIFNRQQWPSVEVKIYSVRNMMVGLALWVCSDAMMATVAGAFLECLAKFCQPTGNGICIKCIYIFAKRTRVPLHAAIFRYFCIEHMREKMWYGNTFTGNTYKFTGWYAKLLANNVIYSDFVSHKGLRYRLYIKKQFP